MTLHRNPKTHNRHHEKEDDRQENQHKTRTSNDGDRTITVDMAYAGFQDLRALTVLERLNIKAEDFYSYTAVVYMDSWRSLFAMEHIEE